jgi:hypothetical protein
MTAKLMFVVANRLAKLPEYTPDSVIIVKPTRVGSNPASLVKVVHYKDIRKWFDIEPRELKRLLDANRECIAFAVYNEASGVSDMHFVLKDTGDINR